MHKSEKATVVFLRDREGRICLARKKQHIHKKDGEALSKSRDTWNGYGGKFETPDKTVFDTALRELFDEAGVVARPEDLKLVGRVGFFWKGNGSAIPDMDVCFFFLDCYDGEPTETDEMNVPCFFPVLEIPYNDMMPGDQLFLPHIFRGHTPVGKVYFDGDGKARFVEEEGVTPIPWE